jgi:hypothetical protein
MATEPCLPFSDREKTRHTLIGIRDVLSRCRLTSTALCPDDDIVKADGDPGPNLISDALSLELLKFALGELQVLQRQLHLPFVLWAALRHRDERAVWRPHRKLRVRQAFRDGACVAELLVAVRIIIQNPQIAQKDHDLRRTLRLSHFQHALRITAAIAGNSAPIEAVFRKAPRTGQPAHLAATDERVRLLPWQRRTARPLTGTAERVRLLPWLRRTASWQAAYNTACIYSALAQREAQLEGRVVASLRRAIDSRDSEMERPYDWIECDPDFLALRKAGSKKYPKFARFLQDQKGRDYPGQPQTVAEDEHHDAPADGTRDQGPTLTGTFAAGS